MKPYKVLVVTTFRKWYQVEAETEDEAREEVADYDDTIDTDDFETEIEVYR